MSRLLLPVLYLILISHVFADSEVASPATTITSSLSSAAWLKLALKEAAAIPDPLSQANVYAKVAVFQARLGDINSYQYTLALAEQSLADVESPPSPSPVKDAKELAMPLIVQALARSGDDAQANAFANEQARDNQYSISIYHSYIAAGQVERGDLNDALVTAQALNKYDRRRVLKAIVEALAIQGEFERAEHVMSMISDDASEWSDGWRAIASAQAKKGHYSDALAVAEKLRYSHDKQDVFIKVAEAQAGVGDYIAAHVTAASVPLGEKIISSSPSSPEYGRRLAYTTIARLQLKRGDIAGAKTTAALFEGELKPYLLNEIVQAEVRANNLVAARKTAEAIPQDISYGITSPGVEAMHAVSVALARSGDFDQALQVADAIPQPNGILQDIAFVALARGNKETAGAIAKRLDQLDPVQGDRMVRPMRNYHDALRFALLKKELGDSAALDQKIEDLGRAAETAEYPQQVTWAKMQLFNLYVSTRDFEALKILIPSLPPEVLKPAVAGHVFNAIQLGQIEDAEHLAALEPDPGVRVQMLESIAEANPAVGVDKKTRISQLPSPYERGLSYIDAAERAWIAEQRKPPVDAISPLTK